MTSLKARPTVYNCGSLKIKEHPTSKIWASNYSNCFMNQICHAEVLGFTLM